MQDGDHIDDEPVDKESSVSDFDTQETENVSLPLNYEEQEPLLLSNRVSDEFVQNGNIIEQMGQLHNASTEMRDELKKTQIFISKWYKKNKSLLESIQTPINALVEETQSISTQYTDINGIVQDLSTTLHLHTSSITSAQIRIEELVSISHKDLQKVKRELTLIFYLLGIGFILLFIVGLMK